MFSLVSFVTWACLFFFGGVKVLARILYNWLGIKFMRTLVGVVCPDLMAGCNRRHDERVGGSLIEYCFQGCCCRFCRGAPTTDESIHAPVLHDASQIGLLQVLRPCLIVTNY